MLTPTIGMFDNSFGFSDDWGDLKFTLKYRGPLKSAQRKGGIKELTYDIRQQLDPQLRHRWRVTPDLKIWMSPPHNGRLPIREKSNRSTWYSKRVGNYLFTPLVVISDNRPLVAELDIRILWRGNAGSILERGNDGIDLDNRLSVLLDALTVPQANQLLTEEPAAGEQQTFCLLEDDRLVVKLSISAEPLTSIPEVGEPKSFADVSIDVVVRRGDGYEVPFGDF